MATRRKTILAFLAALVLVLSAGVVVRAAPDVDDKQDKKVECKGGTLTRTGNTTTCNIIQTSTTGDNRAECKLHGNRPDEIQICNIKQTSGAGNNRVRVRMTIDQERSAPPFTGSCPGLRSLLAANQNGCQKLTVTQTSGSGFNSVEAMLRITQEIEHGIGPVPVKQRQNVGQDARIHQKSTSGGQLTRLDQFREQEEEAKVRADQFQRSTAHGNIAQNSAGISKAFANQKPRQEQEAPAGSTQVQDPEDFCCSVQLGNPANLFEINQKVSQLANLRAARQSDRIFGNCVPTSGNCTIKQSVTTNQGTTLNTCSQRGGCSIFIVCAAGSRCVAGTSEEGLTTSSP